MIASIFAVLLFVFILRMGKLYFWAKHRTQKNIPEYSLSSHLPRVTIQLPIRNEATVAERVLMAVSQLNYPREKMEIQILDDSSDETKEILDRVSEELKGKGFDISLLRRNHFYGHKGGALAEGCRKAKGEFLAVFDSDAIPEPKFLLRLLPYFNDSNVGLVQGRWTYLNWNENFLTRLQAAIIDLNMGISLAQVSDRGGAFHFSGNGGLWRRACVESVGGWKSGALCEDLDLSIRGAIKGWVYLHIPEVETRTELPSDWRAFCQQQGRWFQGTAEVLRENFSLLLLSPIPWKQKLKWLFYLISRFRIIIILAMVILFGVQTIGWGSFVTQEQMAYGLILVSILILSFGCALGVAAQVSGRGFFAGFPFALTVIGYYIASSFSLIHYSLLGLIRKNSFFFRTPKKGFLNTKRYQMETDRGHRMMLITSIVAESCFCLFFFMILSLHYPSLSILEELGLLFLGYSFGSTAFASSFSYLQRFNQFLWRV